MVKWAGRNMYDSLCFAAMPCCKTELSKLQLDPCSADLHSMGQNHDKIYLTFKARKTQNMTEEHILHFHKHAPSWPRLCITYP